MYNSVNQPSGENLTTLTVLECRFSVDRNSTVATLLSFTAVPDLESFTSHSYNTTIYHTCNRGWHIFPGHRVKHFDLQFEYELIQMDFSGAILSHLVICDEPVCICTLKHSASILLMSVIIVIIVMLTGS